MDIEAQRGWISYSNVSASGGSQTLTKQREHAEKLVLCGYFFLIFNI